MWFKMRLSTAVFTVALASVAFTVALASVATAQVIASDQAPGSIPWIPSHVDVSRDSKANPLRRNLLSSATAFWDDNLASPEDWETYSLKGGALMCALEGTDRMAGRLINDTRNPPSAASAWSGDLKQELQDWYWHELTPTSKGAQLDDYWKFSATMQALGLNGKPKSAGGDNACYRIEHRDPSKQENGHQVPAINQWYRIGGNDYRSTKAHFEFITNIKGGAIYGLYLDGPKSSAKYNWYGNNKDPNPAHLPHLRSLSDILWGYWIRDNPNVKNIRYFFMLGISNELTNQIIASCLQRAKKELSEWPGTSFSTDTDEGHALLGSPNGAAFAYFLLQHKAELGYKTISKITIVRPETDDPTNFVDPSLVFHVADTPQPLEDDESVKAKRQDSHTVEEVEQGDDGLMRVHKFGV